MKKYRLRVIKVDRKCIDSEGEWDGTYDESFEYGIYDEEGFEIEGWDGFRTKEQAREAGEKALKELEEKK